MTLSLQFKTSLDELIKALSVCNPFFVRCVKPNEFKKPNIFDEELCVRQLRYSGMLETARIRAMGYPIRHSFKDFVHRYRLLAPYIAPSSMIDYRELSKKICASLLKNNPHYQLGQTKVFLKYDQDTFLETEREKAYLKYVIIIQRFIKSALLRNWLERRRKAAIVLQKQWRMQIARKKFVKLQNSVERLQARIVSRQTTHAYQQTRKMIIQMQAHCRGYLVRKQIEAKTIAQVQRNQKELFLSEKQSFETAEKSTHFIKTIHQNTTAHFTHTERLERERELEANTKIIDDVFEFLQYASSADEKETKRKSNNVSKMILNFEAESKIKKSIPTKLLSRPVNFYTYETYESRL